MENSSTPLGAPTTEKRTVTPKRLANSAYRTREYLTPAEVEALMKAARQNRQGHRDATMILVAFHHALRVSELIDLRWEQIDWTAATLHIRRLKGGVPSVHPVPGDELRALRRLQRESAASPFIFTSERGGPFSVEGVARMVERAGRAAGLPFKVHPHMLRHATGFKLANDGADTRSLQAYMGHASISNTTRYTSLTPRAFRDFWR